MKITLALLAMQYLGTPYLWGGSNYLGLDCSGLVIKTLYDYGIFLPDMTAQGLHDWAVKKNNQSCLPDEDCLLFFGPSDKTIKHVAIGLNQQFMIEAGGAGRDSLTKTPADLARIDARVRIKPITNRKDLIAAYRVVKK